jgi:restriction endonuclease S subunit
LPSRAKRYGDVEDILLSSVRPNLENYIYLTKDILKENTIISTGFILITPMKNKILSKYLYYIISDEQFTKILIDKTTGANYPSINTDDIIDFSSFKKGIQILKKYKID